MEEPIWLSLLKQLEKNPTMPFLIGVLRMYSEKPEWIDDTAKTVQKLFGEMENHPCGNRVVYVRHCTQLDAPVFQFTSANFPPIDQVLKFPHHQLHPQGIWFSTEILDKDVCRVEEIAECLFNSFGHAEALRLKHYSCELRFNVPPGSSKWRAFDDVDDATIAGIVCRASKLLPNRSRRASKR